MGKGKEELGTASSEGPAVFSLPRGFRPFNCRAGAIGIFLLGRGSARPVLLRVQALPIIRSAPVLTVRSVGVLDRGSVAGTEPAGEGPKARYPILTGEC